MSSSKPPATAKIELSPEDKLELTALILHIEMIDYITARYPNSPNKAELEENRRAVLQEFYDIVSAPILNQYDAAP